MVDYKDWHRKHPRYEHTYASIRSFASAADPFCPSHNATLRPAINTSTDSDNLGPDRCQQLAVYCLTFGFSIRRGVMAWASSEAAERNHGKVDPCLEELGVFKVEAATRVVPLLTLLVLPSN